MSKLQSLLVGAAASALACTSWASTIYTVDTTIGAGNDPIQASADFSLTGNTLQLTLTNDTTPITKIIQELTGINFTISGNPTLVAVSGTADASINCAGVASGSSCDTTTGTIDLFHDTPPNLSNGATPTGWAFLPNYALFTFAAGSGSFKPWGIVNDSIVGSGTNSGTSNPQHNPMLLGPVTFTFTFDGLLTAPMITGVQFYWGTGGDHRAGTCTSGCSALGLVPPASIPEPSSLALLALGVLAMAGLARRRG